MPDTGVRASGPVDAVAPRAGLVRRLGALLYDFLAAIAVLWFATFPLLFFTGGDAITPGHVGLQAYLLVVIFGLFGWSWRRGQTLGLRSWGLKLVSLNGEPVSWRQAAIRFLAAGPSIGLLGLGVFWQLFDRDGLAWHDRISGTALVRAPPRKRKPKRG